MGEPLRIDHASPACWAPPEPRRIVLLCTELDAGVVELVRPQLELQALRVDIVVGTCDPHTVSQALAADRSPTVLAVVVSRTRSRRVARPLVDAFSDVAGPLHRLLILDLRRGPSALQQVRVLSAAIAGLELTMGLGRENRAALTSSATMSPRATGERRLSPCPAGTRPLRVVEPPVLLSPAVHHAAQTIPARTRFRLAPRRAERRMAATCPELPVV